VNLHYITVLGMCMCNLFEIVMQIFVSAAGFIDKPWCVILVGCARHWREVNGRVKPAD